MTKRESRYIRKKRTVSIYFPPGEELCIPGNRTGIISFLSNHPDKEVVTLKPLTVKAIDEYIELLDRSQQSINDCVGIPESRLGEPKSKP